MSGSATISDAPPVGAARVAPSRQAVAMLAVATVGFAVNFWAWALLSPLAPKFKDILALSSLQQALVVAVPVVVGSLGRIPVGALTDRYGGRIMFPLVSVATIVPVLYLGLAGHASLAGLLVGGFFLGIGGTAFAVGVPFVSAWFPPAAARVRHRRVRRRHGRHRDLRTDHGQAGDRARHCDAVCDHRDRAGRAMVCWPRWCCATPPVAYVPTEPLTRRLAADVAAAGRPGRPPRCTRSRSAATSRSPSTCPLTSRPPTG